MVFLCWLLSLQKQAAPFIIQTIKIDMRRVQANQQNCDLQAQIKADFFTGIFQNMTKNMKQNQNIFFIFTNRQMKMWLRQSSKTTQLQLKIDSKAFHLFSPNFPNGRTIYRKYQLKKFLYFSNFFQSCKGLMKLVVTRERVQFRDSNNGVRNSSFPVRGQEISKQEQDDLMSTTVVSQMDQKNSCKLVFHKSKMIQQVVHAGNAMKINRLWFSYLSNEKKLRFDFKSNEGCYLKVKAQEQLSRGSQISKVVFPFRKLKLATSLIQSQKPFKMELSNNALIIHYDEENRRKYNISILSQKDQHEDL